MIVVGTMALTGCQLTSGSTGSSSPARLASASPSASPSTAQANIVGAQWPIDAVAMLLPLADLGDAHAPSACRLHGLDRWSREAGCPVTLRLQQRLQETTSSAGDDPICLCHDHAEITIAETADDSRTSRVTASFRFANASTPSREIGFDVVNEQGGWVVDETFCLVGPRNSIYDHPIVACS